MSLAPAPAYTATTPEIYSFVIRNLLEDDSASVDLVARSKTVGGYLYASQTTDGVVAGDVPGLIDSLISTFSGNLVSSGFVLP